MKRPQLRAQVYKELVAVAAILISMIGSIQAKPVSHPPTWLVDEKPESYILFNGNPPYIYSQPICLPFVPWYTTWYDYGFSGSKSADNDILCVWNGTRYVCSNWTDVSWGGYVFTPATPPGSPGLSTVRTKWQDNDIAATAPSPDSDSNDGTVTSIDSFQVCLYTIAYEEGTAPTGGKIASPSPDIWVNDPTHRFQDQVVDGTEVGLVAAWDPPWEDIDEEVWIGGCCSPPSPDKEDLVGGFYWIKTGAGAFSGSQSAQNSQFTAGEGGATIKLRLRDEGYYYDDTPNSPDYTPATGSPSQVTLRYYESHLGRDMVNLSELNTRYPGANCAGATNHAYNGLNVNVNLYNGNIQCPWVGGDITDLNYDPVTGEYDPLPTGSKKGDVILYGDGVAHIETLIGSGEATWGANNDYTTPENWNISSIGNYVSLHGPGAQYGQIGSIKHYSRP